MKRLKKTYGIYQLAEKHTSFRLGQARVKVSFTGGIVTKKGVTPATFTTSDPIVQLAIEQSDDFRRGAIREVSRYPMDGEVMVGKNPQKKRFEGVDEPRASLAEQYKPAQIPATEAHPSAEASLSAKAEGLIQKGGEEGESEESSLLSDQDGHDGESDVEPLYPDMDKESDLEIIDASCKDVAKQYLQEHFGENPAKLRTRDDVQRCAAKYGLQFNFV